MALPRDNAGRDPRDDMLNKFAVVPTSLPVAQKSPTGRVEAAFKILGEMKSSPIAFVALFLTNLMANMPKFLRFAMSADIYAKHSTLFSNVAGPAEQVSIFNQKIVKMMGVFPNFVHQFIFVSYAGNIYGSVCIDDSVVEDPELMKRCFGEELQSLQAAVQEEQANALQARRFQFKI